MITPIILNIVFLLLTAYLNIISPYLDQKYNIKRNENIQNSLKIIEKDGFLLTVYEYPVKTLIKIECNGSLTIDDIKIIDIKDTTYIDNLTIKNVKLIKNFNLKVGSLEIIDSNYKIRDFAIFDKYDNLRFMYNDKSKKELIHYAKSYSISPYALRYFTDAKYFQFSNKRKTKELRVSNPYSLKDNEVYVIIPKMVNHREVNVFELNVPYVNFMYINENIQIVRLEKKSCFKHIKIDENNKRLMIRNKTLVYKKSKAYVKYDMEPFKSVSQTEKLEGFYKTNTKLKRTRVNGSKGV